ncbi:MAG: MmpS family transport accessory protein [Bacteroidota bacterium]
MKNHLKKTGLFITLVIFMLGACKKSKDEEPSANNRKIKYEVTGNFTGKLVIVYSDNVSGNTVVSEVTLPWTKEITYASNIHVIGIGGSSSSVGVPGQNATLKIYAGGVVKASQTTSAGTVGELSLATIAYDFK